MASGLWLVLAKDFLIGFDPGSYTFRMVAARFDSDNPDGIEILAASSFPAAGIRRGSVNAIDDVARATMLVRSDLERKLNAAIAHAFVGVGGSHVGSRPSRGLVVVSRADNRVGADDVRRVLEAAGALSFGQNIEVLNVIPREFIVDGEGGMRDVEGIQGKRLEVDAVVLAAASQQVKGLRQALSQGDVSSYELVVSPLATARAVLTPRQRELGVAVVDIGHGTTDISVFEDGHLLAVSILPIGGAHLTNDIAIGLRCSIDAAERAKHEHGVANAGSVPKRETFEVFGTLPSEEPTAFSRRELAEIIDARLDEIFELVADELKRMERWRLLPAGIVLTGGTANIPGLVDVARRAFRLPVQLGYSTVAAGPKDIVSDFAYCTALGLVLTGVDMEGTRKRRAFPLPSLGRPRGPKAGRVKKFLKSLLP